MNIEHPDKLGDVLALLKRHGVRRFALGGMSVEFAATEAPMKQEALPQVEDEKCNCGCAVHQHNEHGLCLNGCDAEKCAPPEK